MLKLTATKQAPLGIFRKLHAVKLTVLLSSLFVSKWQITGCTLFVTTAVQMHSHFTPCCTLCSPFTKSWSTLQLESSHNNLMAGKMKTCRQKLFVRLRLQTLNNRVTKKKGYRHVLLNNSKLVRIDKMDSDYKCPWKNIRKTGIFASVEYSVLITRVTLVMKELFSEAGLGPVTEGFVGEGGGSRREPRSEPWGTPGTRWAVEEVTAALVKWRGGGGIAVSKAPNK